MALASPDIGSPGPSASSTSPIKKCDVYLSFRGEDVRHGFVSHLYSALRRKGIVTFRDDDIWIREHIPGQIYQAIEQSQFAIVVFSRNYASSTVCLEELVKIMESKSVQGLTVFPVFYHVDPSDVRHQRRSIGEAFRYHETRFPADKVRRWRDALRMAANLSGFYTGDRDEVRLIEGIVEFVWNKLYYKSSYNLVHSGGDIFYHSVGDFESKVEKIISLLLHSGTRFLGIWGMGGLGKTTLAQGVYDNDRIHASFDARCFLRNIREASEKHGLAYLKRKLLFNLGLKEAKDDYFEGEMEKSQFSSWKRVLIILDDVSHKSQLEILAGIERCFSPWSKIIITTRDKSLLPVYRGLEIYEVGALDPAESLTLLRERAFIDIYSNQDYLDLLNEIIEYACGVPLVLKFLETLLSPGSESQWRNTLDKCRERLPEEIFSTLRTSYDGLEEFEWKTIFLDIACFFNGRTKFEVIDILETCYASSIIIYGIEVLIAKSLLSSSQSNLHSRHNAKGGQDMHDRLQKMRSGIFLPTFMYYKLLHEASQESLHMHYFVQEMGRGIVYRDSPIDAGRRSRLWNIKDIDRVLKVKGNKGKRNIEGILVDLHHLFEADWHPECFSKMQSLRLLDLSRVKLAHKLNCLPSALKFLRWDCYALESLPPFNELQELESLQLRSSNIKRLWDGAPVLHMLRTIDLSNSDDLMETPDFSGTPNLEKLLFDYCVNLFLVHESVGQLKKLVELSLRYCINLETLPTCLDMNKLEVFNVGECSKLEKLPEFSKNMRKLYFLDVRNTDITEIPLSVINLENMKYLDLSGCNKLKSIPKLPPKSIIRANKDPFLASTLDMKLLIESGFSKDPSVAVDPIHILIDSKGKEEMPPWFEQEEIRHSKDDSGEVVTITANIPSDLANSEGEWWGIAVCIIFECASEEAWRGFAMDWKFQDYNHNDDKKGGRPHKGHEDADIQVDSTDETVHLDSMAESIHSKKTSDDDPLADVFAFEQNLQAETECQVYKAFFPIHKENCRQHPSGEGSQVDLTLSFPTTNTIGKVIIHSKETSFGDLEIVEGGWRLVCKKDLDASGAQIRHEAVVAEDNTKFVLNEIGGEMPSNCENLIGDIQSNVDVDSSSVRIKHETEVAADSTEFAGNKLGDEMPSNFEHLVGDIQSKVDRIISLLKMESNDICSIGIWGESGIGKTTIARLVYYAIQSKFDVSCFLDNVREESERIGIASLQKKLLSEIKLGEHDIDGSCKGAKKIRKYFRHRKVLLILDDVSERSQLEDLAGNEEWFGAGSKIVITTTNRILLTMYEPFEEHEVKRLHHDESLELLCQEAFKKDKPEQVYSHLAKEAIKYACGLPLVLKVLGSFLCDKDEDEWRNASEKLRQNSPTAIFGPLRISYDGLGDEAYKRIFLDIACFFNREPKFKVINMLEICSPHSTSGIKVLIEKSMLNVTHSNSDLRQHAKDPDMHDRIKKMRRDLFLPTYLYDWLIQEASKEYLYMHDLLQEMGKNIVIQESPTNAGRRSRLWALEDFNDVLKEGKGTGNVQSIVLYKQQRFEADWHPDCFSNMQGLRLLDLSKVKLSRELISLPRALKIMRWDYYALGSLPPFDPLHELESLQLRSSKITRLWDGAPELRKLRTIDLSNSDNLRETPDLSGTPNLEKLLLNYCENLVRVHKSVRKLKKVVELSLRYCTNLETLPTRLDMDKLEVFILGECSKLEKLPKFSKNMRSLYFLDVRGTDITEIPQSIIRLTNLKYLDLTFCSRLKSTPELPPNLIISASNCRLLEPTSALRHLYSYCAPKGPIHLFYDFQLLTRIPSWFGRWEYCWGKDTSSEFVTITADIPSNVVADSNEERWGIAVCVVFQFLSQAWLGFSVDWKFNDKCHRNKTKIHGTPASFMHDCRVYVGFCPLDAIEWTQHASGEGSRLDLTLDFPATNIVKGLRDLEIMGCGWRLACKKEFDEWSESRSPSPSRLGFLNDW